MFTTQCKILLNFYMHWLVPLLCLTTIRATVTLRDMDRPGNNAAAHVTENVSWFDGALEKISLYPPCQASVALFVMMCYYYHSYLASLWTSSLLLMPPVGLNSTLKHLSNWSGSMRGCNKRMMIRMSSRNTAAKNIQAHLNTVMKNHNTRIYKRTFIKTAYKTQLYRH